MSRPRTLGFLGSLSLIVGLFWVLPSLGAGEDEKEGRDGLYRPLGLFTEVLSLVQSNYVEKPEMKGLMNGAFSGMTEAMDPFAEYVPPDRMAAFTAAEQEREKGKMLGVGLVLAHRFGYPVVVAALAGGPAAGAGVKGDDVIEKVDDRPTRQMPLWEVESALSGPAGSRVRIAVVRDGKPRRRTLEIVRGSWSPEAPSASRVEGELVVKVSSFEEGTAGRLRKILEPLDRKKPLLLDLRGNASGSLDEAARAAALFVPAGPLGELKGRKIETKVFTAAPGERAHEGRVVVLVDSGTAGAAELFASALREGDPVTRPAEKVAGTVRPDGPGATTSGATEPKEVAEPKADVAAASEPDEPTSDDESALPSRPRSRVRVVGEPTSGMGFVSKVIRLQSGGALRLSVGKVRTRSGKPLSPKGLQPDDRVFPAPADEGSDKAPVDLILQRGLKLLAEVEPAKAAS